MNPLITKCHDINTKNLGNWFSHPKMISTLLCLSFSENFTHKISWKDKKRGCGYQFGVWKSLAKIYIGDVTPYMKFLDPSLDTHTVKKKHTRMFFYMHNRVAIHPNSDTTEKQRKEGKTRQDFQSPNASQQNTVKTSSEHGRIWKESSSFGKSS